MPSTDTRAALAKRLEGIADEVGQMDGWADRAADIGEAADLLARSAPEERGEGERRGIYVASKAKHAAKWLALRERGYPIRSTWIDESEPYATLDWSGLWDRCTREASHAAVLVLYAEAGDVLTGALVELGAALSHGVPVLFVGDPVALRNVARDGRIRHVATLSDAMDQARALASPPPPPPRR